MRTIITTLFLGLSLLAYAQFSSSLLVHRVTHFPLNRGVVFQYDTLEVILVAGQSNADGRAVATISTTPYELGDTMPNTFFYIQNGSSYFTPLRAGFSSSEATKFGPELSLLDTIRQTQLIGVYKYAVGGTTVAATADVKLDWNISSTGEHIDIFVAGWPLAKKILRGRGYVPKPIALIWMQGESDAANSTYAAAFDTNTVNTLTALVTRIGYPDLPIIVGRIANLSGTGSFKATVRAAQDNLPNVLSNVVEVIDTDTYPSDDNLHYNYAGQIQFGRDIYAALKLLGLIQ